MIIVFEEYCEVLWNLFGDVMVPSVEYLGEFVFVYGCDRVLFIYMLQVI